MAVTVDNYGEVLKERESGIFKPHVLIQGGLVTICEWASNQQPPPKSKDQIIREFSPGARLRLLKNIAIIDWDKIPKGLFVTLTYPDDCAKCNPNVSTMHRSWFMRDIENHLQVKVPSLWRREMQRRKSGVYKGKYVQHFHLCLFTSRYLSKETIRETWRKIIGAEGPLCTDVKRMRSGEHAAFYLAKYLSKRKNNPSLDDDLHLNNPGRAWGWTRKHLIPIEEPRYLSNLTPVQINNLMKEARRMRKVKPEWSTPSITLLGKNADKITELIRCELS